MQPSPQTPPAGNDDHRRGPILGLIPARGGSKGIPDKNLRPLAGKPLIEHAIQCGLSSRLLDRTIVTTDSERIAAAAKTAGAEVPFLRPAELAKDESPTLGVVQHALRWLEEQQGWLPAIVVLLQPTAPLRKAEHVDEALERFLASPADSLVSVCRVASHYHPDWQFCAEDGLLTRHNGEPLWSVPTQRQLLRPTFIRNGAIYAFHRDVLLRGGSLYGQRCLAYEMPAELSVNIDTPDDLRAAEGYLANASKAGAAA